MILTTDQLANIARNLLGDGYEAPAGRTPPKDTMLAFRNRLPADARVWDSQIVAAFEAARGECRQ